MDAADVPRTGASPVRRLATGRVATVGRRPIATAAFGVTMAAAMGAYLTAGDPVLAAALYNGIGVATLGAVALGVARNRPVQRAGWVLFGLGLGCWVAGDLLWDYAELVAGEDPFPSAADAFYLAGYPLLAFGLLRLIRLPGTRIGAPVLIDMAIVGIGFGLVFWTFLIMPALADEAATEAQRFVAMLYPVGDIVLLAVVFRVVLSGVAASASLALIAGGLLASIVADCLFAQTFVDLTASGPGLELLWLAGYAAFGAAALHPSMAAPMWGRALGPELAGPRLALLIAAALIPPAILVVQWLAGWPIEALAIAIASATLFSLVVLRIVGLVGALRASIAERDALAAELRHLALHDALTGLANRTLFADRLSHALNRRDPAAAVGLIFLDLDGFKAINDAHGHATGDAVLQAVAEQLAGAIRAGDTAARLGGDEFAVILDRVASVEAVGAVAHRIRRFAEQPIRIGERELAPRVSVGLTLAIPGQTDPDAALHAADASMYADKRRHLTASLPAAEAICATPPVACSQGLAGRAIGDR